MKSHFDLCETCPTCRSRAHEVARSRYIGSGELTTGYLVRVWSCSQCKREWEDAALAQLNADQEKCARLAYEDAVGPARIGRDVHAMPSGGIAQGAPAWLERAG